MTPKLKRFGNSHKVNNRLLRFEWKKSSVENYLVIQKVPDCPPDRGMFEEIIRHDAEAARATLVGSFSGNLDGRGRRDTSERIPIQFGRPEIIIPTDARVAALLGVRAARVQKSDTRSKLRNRFVLEIELHHTRQANWIYGRHERNQDDARGSHFERTQRERQRNINGSVRVSWKISEPPRSDVDRKYRRVVTVSADGFHPVSESSGEPTPPPSSHDLLPTASSRSRERPWIAVTYIYSGGSHARLPLDNTMKKMCMIFVKSAND
ncbi:hypothetical protein EVAR_45299_1 [Eumeta japonica]|uniref:Uncharacterized protein n=1 Tax=Eumeta variegata TaxID=151549 RepID=A0A4C1YAN3_EUMVA|nr:hypothetical protein EVAR_45299_1 [Eumeta japonica]